MTYVHGMSRREFLRVGTLGVAGLTLPELFSFQAVSADRGARASATSVVLLWMDGGPSQLDTWDPKPDAPAQIRGAFRPIRTNVPGIRICELLPRMAQKMDQVALLRTVSHTEREHEGAQHLMLTGRRRRPSLAAPSLGSVVSRELGAAGAMPPYVALPSSGFASGYGGAGSLDAAFNPFSVGAEPEGPSVASPEGTAGERSGSAGTPRRVFDSAFRRFDGMPEQAAWDSFYYRAYERMRSPEAKRAFIIAEEPEKLRDLYGRTPFGQSCLMARRLVEAGARFVTVAMGGWDTHAEHVDPLRNKLLPSLDSGYSALLEDLDQRGLLATTLVIWMGEFGRTPQVNPRGGRDHWPETGCVLFSGAGVKGGQVIGTTDAEGAQPVDRKVSPQDVVATIYQKLGIDRQDEETTQSAWPMRSVSGGEPIRELIS